MHRLTLAVLITIVVIGCSDGSPTAADTGARTIVVLGDSLTAGPGLRPEEMYPALLQQRVTTAGHDYQVINAGVGGDTSSDALARFEEAVVPGTRILVLAIGANDGLRRVPVATVEKNISAMIERAQSRGIKVLLCQMEAPPLGGFDYTIAFHRIYTRLAERYNVPLVPFFLFGILGNENLDLDDSLHPNAAGHKVIAETIWPHLRPML